MKSLQSIASPDLKFLLCPISDIETLNSLPAILTLYYDKTLRFYAEHKWNGQEAQVKRLAVGLCKGIYHMHECGFAHRDLKLDNILLKNADGDPVIIDFGLANAEQLSTGTRNYIAPEQLKEGKGPFIDSKWWNL